MLFLKQLPDTWTSEPSGFFPSTLVDANLFNKVTQCYFRNSTHNRNDVATLGNSPLLRWAFTKE